MKLFNLFKKSKPAEPVDPYRHWSFDIDQRIDLDGTVELIITTSYPHLRDGDRINLIESDGFVHAYFYDIDVGIVKSDSMSNMILDFLDRNDPVRANINPDKGLLRIGFYKPVPKGSLSPKTTTTTVTGEYDYGDVGDLVSFEYDVLEEKMIALVGNNDIGYVPSKKSEELNDYYNEGYMLSGQILSVSETDSGKFKYKVKITLE